MSMGVNEGLFCMCDLDFYFAIVLPLSSDILIERTNIQGNTVDKGKHFEVE